MRFAVLVIIIGAFAACASSSGGSSARGTAKRGESCNVDNDCAADEAVCTSGVGGAKVCTGPLTGDCFMTECSSDPSSIANACAGVACLTFPSNQQGKAGICSVACDGDATCGPRGVCTSTNIGKFCLTPCSSDADCHNGYVCVVADSSGRKVCLVNPR